MSKILGAALGKCVHVAGILSFLNLAEQLGHETHFLGPATPIEALISAIQDHDPDVVAVSYRLTPETGEAVLRQFAGAVQKANLQHKRFCFGGTPPVAEKAQQLGLFEACFSGEEPLDAIIAYLQKRKSAPTREARSPQNVVERIKWKSPFPLIRHHFGQPTIEDTVEGIRQLSESGLLDVVSLGPDQDAQENFFHPERQDPKRKGAGGVPARSADDYRAMYRVTRRGNYPLMRCYAGTDDLLLLAKMYLETINNAWAAVPIFWFNVLDHRGPMALEESIRVHQQVMHWHAERGITVEVNEPHHWSLRDAPDVIYVATSYLSAYNAKAMGVQHYIAQYMFNTPAGLSDSMDLARMLASCALVESLADEGFSTYRQTRTGLPSYPVDQDAAGAHLAASIYLQMALKPHIIHVVSACEAHHAATADDIIHNCRAAQHVIAHCLRGMPDMEHDPQVQHRKQELITEAQVLLDGIGRLAGSHVRDPLTDPHTLARAVTIGLLDAPHLKGSSIARGEIVTRVVDGACQAIDQDTGKVLSESDRVKRALGSSAVSS
ncbi:MAG: cobalamin-dependent protein [Chloroflexota bacterium]